MPKNGPLDGNLLYYSLDHRHCLRDAANTKARRKEHGMSVIKKAVSVSTLALVGLGMGVCMSARALAHKKHHNGKYKVKSKKIGKQVNSIIGSAKKQLDSLASDARSKAKHKLRHAA